MGVREVVTLSTRLTAGLASTCGAVAGGPKRQRLAGQGERTRAIRTGLRQLTHTFSIRTNYARARRKQESCEG